MPRRLALLNIGNGEDASPAVFSGIAEFRKRTVQNAGNAFFDRFERTAGSVKGNKEEEDRPSGGEEEQSPSKSAPKKKKAKKDQEALKLPESLKGEDLYALLDADVGASQDDLKKAYRKICLTAHPDKAPAGSDIEAVNLHFVNLQEAFNILSDVKKRRKYDSMGEFDETVPTKLKDGQDFFEVFEPVFRRNAKWSERKPVPELGDESMSYEKAKTFYDFWFDFESWRDLDEKIMEECGEDCFEDLEDAECREHKRQMERENMRIRAKFMKVERQRIFGFVELAEKLDPRMRAERDKQFAAKEAVKNAKEAKRLAEEKKARGEEEKKAVAEEKAKAARAEEKAKREEEKQVKKFARSKLRKVTKDLNIGLAEDPLQEFLLALDSAEDTDKLTADIQAGGAEVLLSAMKAKGVEPIILKLIEDENSTDEGSPSEEEAGEVLDPKEVARLEKERLDKKRKDDKKRKAEDEQQKKLREEDNIKKAEEKAVRDAKKKVEQEKQEKERLKNQKKQADKIKREEEQATKKAAKLEEQALAAKEANKKQAEEQKEKQKAENEAEKEAKAYELWTFEFERDRLFRCEAFEKLAWPAVLEAAKAAFQNPITAIGLATCLAEPPYEDPEDLLDAQLSCLGSFFVIGVRPSEDTPPLSSGLRSRVKKLRTKIRTAAEKGEFCLEPAEGTAIDEEALEQLLSVARGETPEVAVAKEAPAAAEQAAPATSGKKKAKVKAAPADEDLDALLEEFGMTPGEGANKKKNSKKK